MPCFNATTGRAPGGCIDGRVRVISLQSCQSVDLNRSPRPPPRAEPCFQLSATPHSIGCSARGSPPSPSSSCFLALCFAAVGLLGHRDRRGTHAPGTAAGFSLSLPPLAGHPSSHTGGRLQYLVHGGRRGRHRRHPNRRHCPARHSRRGPGTCLLGSLMLRLAVGRGWAAGERGQALVELLRVLAQWHDMRRSPGDTRCCRLSVPSLPPPPGRLSQLRSQGTADQSQPGSPAH